MPFVTPKRYIEMGPRARCHDPLAGAIEWETAVDHFQSGVIGQPWNCGADTTETAEPCPPSPAVEKMLGDRGVPEAEGEAFTLYVDYQCGPVGIPLDEARRRALHKLDIAESKGLSRRIVNNLLDPNDAEDLTPTAGTAVSLAGALGLLEQWSAENLYGCSVIHAPIVLNPYVMEGGLAHWDGERYVTGLHNRWSFGAFNSDLRPTTTQPGTAWLYVSDVIRGMRGEAFTTPSPTSQALDRQTNDVVVLAERTYALWTECSTARILTKISCCC